MEYFIGSIITLFAIGIMAFVIKHEFKKNNSLTIKYSQSNVFEIIKHLIPKNMQYDVPETQSTKHHDSIFVKIFVLDDKAYWIKENTFYSADYINGEVDESTTTPVDTMAMDKVQLKKMIFIIENLTRGNFNDYWN